MIFGFENVNFRHRMKIKSLLAVFSFFIFLISFISCDDDLNAIGGSIQPPSDTISVSVDTIALTARTISMFDSVYARTTKGVLGKYEDDVFGTIKADYLCQFSFPEEKEFKGTFKQIDSVQFVIDYRYFTGDSLALMGLSLYQVTSPLTKNFYTNIDPAQYCDMSVSLANQAYSVSGSKILASSSGQREIIADLGVNFGQRLYSAWADGTVKDTESFNKFFPGIYVTTNFGSGSMIKVIYTSIDTYYTYTYEKDGLTRDSTDVLTITANQEIIQLNHIQNKNPEALFVEGTGATYLKTPAGVYTEVVIPIAEIAKSMESKQMSTVNSAQFSLKGYTERESDDAYGLNRPSSILLINKDSVESFFTSQTRNLPDSKTSFVAYRESSSNIYSFGNISALITEYKDKNVESATFYIIPVEVETAYNSSTGGYQTIGMYNYMMPSSAILRSDPANMKLDLVYSKF